QTYPQFLVAAFFVGIAGASFPVGVTYVSKWFPSERQGTALGIFGAGNIGAAITKLLAPMLMVAAGWIMVAQVWAIGLAVSAIVYYLFSQEDPSVQARRESGARAIPFREQMAPLRNLQVWRFSL